MNNISEIVTKQGVMRIDHLVPKIMILNGNGEISQVSHVAAKDNIKFYNLELKNGAIISLGEGTDVLTLDGLKKVENLKPDDYIAYSFGKIKNSKGSLPINWTDDLKMNSIPIKVPKKMSEDLALWLGIVSSKGRYNLDNGCVVASFNNSPKIEKLYLELTEKILKIDPLNYSDKRNGIKTPTVYSPNLVRYLQHLLGSNSNLKKVPQQILEGSLNEQIAFIRGLTLDGYVEQGQLTVYGGVSKRIADFAALILRNNGYAIYQQVRKSGQGNNAYYTKIQGQHHEALKFSALEEEKNKNLNPGGYFVAITKEILESKVASTHANYSSFRNIKQRQAKVCYNHTLDSLDIEYPQDKHFVMIKNIKTDTQDGFEIKVEEDQGLVFQGIILGWKD